MDIDLPEFVILVSITAVVFLIAVWRRRHKLDEHL